MEIKSSKNLLDNVRVNSISVADSGKGKTYFIGTICDYDNGKPFIIDAEGGLATVADKDFDYVTVNTWDEFLEACTWYYNNAKESGYTHLVIDSVTRLQKYLSNKMAPTGKVTQAQWGEILASLTAIIDRLTKTCPTHLHVTAMACESKDDLTGMTKIFPSVQGQFKYDLCGYFDIVLYHDCGMKKDKQVYWTQTEGDERIVAKSRFNSVKQLGKFQANNYGFINEIININKKG